MAFGQNIKLAIRQWKRYPGFSVTVILTLALSIGANTAIFSIVDALLLKALPYTHPERMGTIFTRVTGPRPSDERHHVNGEQWELLRDNVPSLISAVTNGGRSGVNLQAGTNVAYLQAARISAHYFDVLDIRPSPGRNFSEAEDRPHGPKAAILSYSSWKNIFDLNPDVIGRPVVLKGEPYTVIGVLPEAVITPLNADLYTALQPDRYGEGAGTNFDAIVRLRDGATWQRADGEVNSAWSMRTGKYELEHNPGAQVTYYSVPLQQGQSARLRPQVLSLMLAAGLILLIACANLAGLSLVRMMRRTSEVATRLALGGSRWQIQKQLWVENLLLALVGGVTAIGVGFAALRGLLMLLPQSFLPVNNVSLDIRVLAFTLMLSLLTSVLCGMLPALITRKVDVRSSMTSRAVAGAGSLRLRQSLIAGEVALTVVLLAASGLLIRSLIHLETLPPGFNPNGVIAAKASLDDVRFHDPAKFKKLLDDSILALRRIPGVQDAGVGLSLPYERVVNGPVTLSDGKEAGQQDQTDAVYVTPGYFETLRMSLLAGRFFTDADNSEAQKVAIVNQSFAHKFYGGSNPVGRYLDKDTLIVGEVSDVAISSGLNPTAPLMNEQIMYVPATQVDTHLLSLVHTWFQPNWIVRTSAPLEGLTGPMQRAMTSVNPNLPFSGFYSMGDLQAQTLSIQRIEVALLSVMAGLALLLSAIGIFALVANIVAQKTREIGIRMALGSTIKEAMIKIGSSGVRASLAGLVLGLILCAGALRVMNSVIYGIGVYDALTLLTVVFTLALVTVIAVMVPTLRIARLDPANTLRDE